MGAFFDKLSLTPWDTDISDSHFLWFDELNVLALTSTQSIRRINFFPDGCPACVGNDYAPLRCLHKLRIFDIPMMGVPHP